GENANYNLRRANKSYLIALGPDSNAAETVLKALIDNRLVTSSREGSSTQGGGGQAATDSPKPDEILEVSHEALIREWPVLRKWVDASRDELRLERRLLEAETEWEK